MSNSPVLIRLAREEEAAALGDMMARRIHWGTMPKLGRGFVTLFHRHLTTSEHALCVVAEVDGVVAGYAAGLLHCGKFQRQFVLRHGLSAALAVAPRLLSPSVWKIALRLGTYFHRAPHKDPDAEMISLAVESGWGGRGVGRDLTADLLRRMAEAGCDCVKVGTVDVGNERSNRIFQGLGAVVVRTEDFAEGSPVNVYYWRPGNAS